MTRTGVLVAATVVMALAVSLVARGWAQPRPSVARAITHLRRTGDGAALTRPRRWIDRLESGTTARAPWLLPNDDQLRLVGRTRAAHLLLLVGAAAAGFLAPPVALGGLQVAGLVAPTLFVPVGLGLASAAASAFAVHASVRERAAELRADLRHQLSAYLDVVTMLLASNLAHEGALLEAAQAGDGRLFEELRRRAREAATTGRSLVDALDTAGRDLALDELRQVAATTSLSSSEGAPVARTLAAKCATLRSTLMTEQESEARLRTTRLTAPIVGMALVFMALVIYPALHAT